jgi:hypothetical protein
MGGGVNKFDLDQATPCGLAPHRLRQSVVVRKPLAAMTFSCQITPLARPVSVFCGAGVRSRRLMQVSGVAYLFAAAFNC